MMLGMSGMAPYGGGHARHVGGLQELIKAL